METFINAPFLLKWMGKKTEDSLEERVEKAETSKNTSWSKTAVVDIFSNITYTTVVGGLMDYFSGLPLNGIVAARITSLGTNALTSAPYGMYTEFVYRITRTPEQASRTRKWVIDTLAFATFQVPVYSAVVGVGSFVSEGRVDFEKVKHGAEYLTLVSPLIGPTLGMYMNLCRKVTGLDSTATGSYIK